MTLQMENLEQPQMRIQKGTLKGTQTGTQKETPMAIQREMLGTTLRAILTGLRRATR